MTFNFDERIERRHSDSAKWNKYPADVLPMWVADMDFRSAPCIIDALHARVAHGVFGYSGHPQPFIDQIIDWLAAQYQWHIRPEWLVIIPGVVPGLNLSLRAFTRPEEKSIAPGIIYPPFHKAARLAQRQQHHAPLVLRNGRWQIDLAALAPQMNGSETLLLLCNPQNPGGTVYNKGELETHLAFARQHNLIVCSDEIHCDLILEPGVKHIPFATLSEDAAQRSVTLMSPSKTWNIAGLGASFAVIPNPELRQRFVAAGEGILPHVDVLALAAATAALRHGGPWRDALIGYLRHNRDRLFNAVKALPGLKMVAPEATYLAWVDASGLDVDNPASWFARHGLGFSPGRDFGDAQYVRINFGCPASTLEEAITRLTRAVTG